MNRLAFIVFLVLGPSLASADTARDLIAIERQLNEMCRGWSGDDPHTGEACEVREKTARLLNKMGWCYGKEGQSGAEMDWHRCGKNSLTLLTHPAMSQTCIFQNKGRTYIHGPCSVSL
jgi:hypothetical protein